MVSVRESAQSKGVRYLGEARLTVDRVDHDLVHATCRGQGAVYDVGHDQRGWYCTCPARTTCAHLTALQLVTIARRTTR